MTTRTVENYRAHRAEAAQAFALYAAHCGGTAPARVPGMCTDIRLANRIALGRTVEEAAAREYLYRWNLALRWRGFGVPHTLGL